MDERIENQEIYCHACGNYVQFPIDLSLNGNHILECPNCGHEHCRVVKDGIISGDRWDSRNGQTYQISPNVITITSTSVSTNYFVFSSANTWATSSSIYVVTAS